MFKLQVEIGCVLCGKPVSDWIVKFTDKDKRFYTKCLNCEAMNTFNISNKITLDRVPLYLKEMSVKSKMDVREVQRLNDARRKYKIPAHIPMEQTYKYARIKLNERVEEERAKWGFND